MNKAFRRLLRISKNKDMSAGLAAMHKCKPTALTNVLGVQSLKKRNLHAYPEQKGSHTQITQWPRIKGKSCILCEILQVTKAAMGSESIIRKMKRASMKQSGATCTRSSIVN